MNLSQSTLPKKKLTIREKVIENEFILMDETQHILHTLNTTSHFIWERCTGENSLDMILKDITSTYDVPKDVAKEDLKDIIEMFHDLGVVELSA